MTSLPPVLDPKSTPADQWAADTTSALDANSKKSSNPAIPHFATAATPERQLPGSFPRGADLSAPPTAEDTKRAAGGMFDSARQYIPAQEHVQKALYNASETAKQYLPDTVSSYLPATNQDPVSLSSPPVGHSGDADAGIGSRSGRVSEAGVDNLPEKRANDSESKKSPRSGTTATSPVSALESGLGMLPQEHALRSSSTGALGSGTPVPATKQAAETVGQTAKQYVPSSVGSYLRGSTDTQSRVSSNTQPQDYTLPSKETPSTSPGGVGSLPGNISEASVAKLPDERIQEHGQDFEHRPPPVGTAPPAQTSSPLARTRSGFGPTITQPAAAPLSVPHVTASGADTHTSKSASKGFGIGSLGRVTNARAGDEPGAGVVVDRPTGASEAGDILGPSAGAQNKAGFDRGPSPRVPQRKVEDVKNAMTQSTQVEDNNNIKAQKTKEGARDVKASVTGVGEAHKSSQDAGVPPPFSPSPREVDDDGAFNVSSTATPAGGAHRSSVLQAPIDEPAAAASGGQTNKIKKRGSATGEGLSLRGAPKASTPSGPAAHVNSASATEQQNAQHVGVQGQKASSKAGEGRHPQKVGLMDKVKGEAMVITGKLGKNEKKVEEGRHLMGK